MQSSTHLNNNNINRNSPSKNDNCFLIKLTKLNDKDSFKLDKPKESRTMNKAQMNEMCKPQGYNKGKASKTGHLHSSGQTKQKVNLSGKNYERKTKTKMPTAGEANLNKRGRSQDDVNHPNSKKVCDPRAEAKIPKPRESLLSKKAPAMPKTASMPTEAQIRQAEIMKKARALKADEILTTAETAAPEVNNNVEVEDIGPEPDIFDEVVNNPNFYAEKQMEDNVTEEAELPEDPIDKAIRTNDPYVNIEILPDPNNPSEPTPGPSGYIYPAKPSDQLDLGFVLAVGR